MDLSKTLERLNSGMRINSAADDAASLAVATNTETSSRLYGKAIQNLNDGISLTNLASEALDNMTSIVSELQELAGQATSSALNSSQRSELNERAQALRAEYERIRQTTQFNSTPLFPAAESTINIQAGIRSQSVIPISIGGSGSNTDFEATVTETVYTGQLSDESSVATSGSVQRDIVVADMNGDGFADLVSTGGVNANLRVRIRLGNGDGTFISAAEYAMPEVPLQTDRSWALVTGDFDGDGLRDVVAASWSDDNESQIHFFSGNSNGTLKTPVSSPVELGIVVTGMSAGDVDNDGDLDLMVNAGLDPLGVFTMVNNGTGEFTALNELLFPTNNRSADDVALADLNNDGNIDLVGGDNLSTIRVSFGNGDGTFGAATSYTGSGGWIEDVALGDMDGDGVLDLVSTNGAGSVAFFKGNSNGTFQARVAITAPGTPYTLALADVTNDGVLDIIGSGAAVASPVFVLVGNGNGTFKAPLQKTASASLLETALGDFNGDGVPDIVGQAYNGNVRVFLSQSSVETTTSDFSLTTVARAQGAVTLFSTIQDQLTVEKGRTAAAAVRLESGLSNADAMRSLFSEASDRIRDIDAADELAKYTALSVRSTIQSALFAHILDGPSVLSLLGQ